MGTERAVEQRPVEREPQDREQRSATGSGRGATSAGRTPEPGDASGPMVAACTGHRCAALWRLQAQGEADGAGGMAELRHAVRRSRGALLTSLDCVGACAQGPLVGVADRRAGSARTGEVTWLVGAAEPERQAALVQWVTDDWAEQAAPAPAALRPHLFRMHRRAS